MDSKKLKKIESDINATIPHIAIDDARYLCAALREAHRIIAEAKRKFAPNTTNSDADDWLRRWNEERGEK